MLQARTTILCATRSSVDDMIMPGPVRRKPWAMLAATAVFLAAILLSFAAVPYILGMLYGWVPPSGSCGDSVGWAMLLSAPVSIPLVVLVSGVLAGITYARMTRHRDEV